MRNLIILLALFCAACASTTASLPSIRPYHMDIQQGNVVTSKMIMQLKPGMTKSQVRFVMGTPLLTDSFHADRWDYFYSLQKEGRLIEQRRVILEFDNDALKRVRGDVIPAGSAGAAPAANDNTNIPPTSIWEGKPDTQKEEKKGVLDKLKFWDSDKKPEQKEMMEPVGKPAVPDDLVDKSAQQPMAKPAEKMQGESTQPKEEKKGLWDKLKFWGDDEKAAPTPEPMMDSKPAPVPASEPVVMPKPEPVVPEPVVPKQVEKPIEKAVEKAVEPVVPKAVPQAAPLPPEEDPTYFERMLEKIGF